MFSIKVGKTNAYDLNHLVEIFIDGDRVGWKEVNLVELEKRGKIAGPDLLKDAERYFMTKKGFRELTGQSKEKYAKERRAFERYWGGKLL